MIKTVELTGSEVKVTDLGGQNAAVKNLGSGSIYVSTKPNITAGADNVIEIPAGAGEVVLDTNGTVYIVGTGKVQCTGTPYATPNFKLPSTSSGGGGGTSDVTKEYVDAQDTTNLNLAKAYTDNAKSEIQTTIDTVNNTLNTHIADQVKHITAEERTAWNAKAETDTATTSADGLMSAADKGKLDGVAANANNYSLPLATASVRGGVKIGYEENGKNYPVKLDSEKMFVNVPWENTTYTNFVKSGSGAKSGLVPAPSTTAGTTKYLREDGTWTVPPNTTYSAATTSNAGLMSSSDKKKLDGIYSGATPVTIRTGNVPKFGDANDTVSLAYISGRKNALVMVYLHETISSLNYSAFDSLLLTGISNSMAASSSNINIGSNTGCTVAISKAGVITLKPYTGATQPQRYIVIYYN